MESVGSMSGRSFGAASPHRGLIDSTDPIDPIDKVESPPRAFGGFGELDFVDFVGGVDCVDARPFFGGGFPPNAA